MRVNKYIVGPVLLVALMAGCSQALQTTHTLPSTPEIASPDTSKPTQSTSVSTTATPPVSSTTLPVGPASLLRVKTSNKYSNLNLEVVVVASDANGNILNVEGSMNARLWENPASSLNGKGQLLQEWKNVQLSVKDYFEDEFGKWVVLKFQDFTPKEVQTAYLEVTILTNNASLAWEGEMPLTPGAA